MQQDVLHYLFDKFDATQVEVVSCVGVQYALAVNAAGCDGGVPIQLGAAPDEGHELVVIQAPHPM